MDADTLFAKLCIEGLGGLWVAFEKKDRDHQMPPRDGMGAFGSWVFCWLSRQL